MAAETTTTKEKPRRSRRKKKDDGTNGNPAVEEAAARIGVDPDADGDQAMLDKAAEDGGEADAARAAADEMDAAADDLPQVDPQEDPPEVEEEEEADPKTREKLESKRRPAPVPSPRQTKKEKQEERQLKANSKPQSPSTRRLGELGKKLPGAEHVKVEKRNARGKLAYVGNYRMADLSQSQSMETFIAEYIKPHFGAGEYQLTGIDAMGREFDGGTVEVLDPFNNADPLPQKDQSSGLVDVVKQMIRDRNQPQASVDPIEQLQRLLTVKQSLDQEDDDKKATEGGTVAAMISAMGQQSQASMDMMMTLLTTMLPLMMKKDEDPVQALLLAKLLDDNDKGSSAPLPPPLPPANPMADVLPIVQVLAEVMKPQQSDGDGLTGVLMQHILNSQTANTLGPKDMVELFESMRGERGTDDFKKTMDNMGFLMNAIQALRAQTEPVQGGFMDSVGQLFSNRDFSSALAGAIRTKTEARAAAAGLPAPQQHRALPAGGDEEAHYVDRAQRARQQRIEIARAAAEAEESALAVERATDPLQHRPRPARPEPGTAPAAPPVVTSPPVAAKPTDPEAAVERVKERTGGKLPSLPPDIGDHINNMIAAEDAGATVESVIDMLFYLGRLEGTEWKQFAETVLHLMHQNDPVRSVAFLSQFLEGLREIGLVNAELVKKVLDAVHEHFEDIVAHLQAGATSGGADEAGEGEGEEVMDENDLTADLPEGFDTEEEYEDEDEEGEDDEAP